MDLVERYVHAIGAYLPRAQRDDIVTELAEDVRSQIEDKEEELGRPLTDAEVEAVLAQRGHPLRVATQYFPQRSLIGPALLPIYFLVLKIVLATVAGAFALVITPIHVFQGAGLLDALLQSIAALLPAIWISIGIVTVVFAVLERSQVATITMPWSPRRLPPVRATGDSNVISRSESIAQAALTAVFLLWWSNGAPLPIPGDVPFWRTLTHEAYLPVLLLSLGAIVFAVVNALRPYWTAPRLGVRAALDGLSATVALAILGMEWTRVRTDITIVTSGAADTLALIPAGIGFSIAITLAIVGVVGIGSCAYYLVRCVRSIARRRDTPGDVRSLA